MIVDIAIKIGLLCRDEEDVLDLDASLLSLISKNFRRLTLNSNSTHTNILPRSPSETRDCGIRSGRKIEHETQHILTRAR